MVTFTLLPYKVIFMVPGDYEVNISLGNYSLSLPQGQQLTTRPRRRHEKKNVNKMSCGEQQSEILELRNIRRHQPAPKGVARGMGQERVSLYSCFFQCDSHLILPWGRNNCRVLVTVKTQALLTNVYSTEFVTFPLPRKRLAQACLSLD